MSPPAHGPTTPACPFCGSDDTKQIALWGGQMITSQARCESCHSYFEVIREARWTTSYEDDRSERQPPDRCC